MAVNDVVIDHSGKNTHRGKGEYVDEQLKDGLTLWYRLSAHLNNWDYEYERDPECALAASDRDLHQRQDDYGDLVTDGAGEGSIPESGSGPSSFDSPDRRSVILQSLKSPMRDPSLRSENTSLSTNMSRLSDLSTSRWTGIVQTPADYDDESFWAVTAAVLGHDFDLDASTVKERVGISEPVPEQKKTRGNVRFLPTSRSKPDLTPSPTQHSSKGSRKDPASSSHPSLHEKLLSLGQSWHWFSTQTELQAYLDKIKQAHDFGVCLVDEDGSRYCCTMRVRGTKKIYSLPAGHYWGAGGSSPEFEFPEPECRSLFWWCLPFPSSLDPESAPTVRQKELDRRYDAAKLSTTTFNSRKISTKKAKDELRTAYKRLVVDVQERERLMGRFSIESLNTVQQLSVIAEILEMYPEAEKWNRELVTRHSHRLGQSSELACQARYKLASLLMKLGDYDSARDASRENLLCLDGTPTTNSLFVRQNIQECMIAMKRRRMDAAMEVLPHLWTLERWHKNDLELRDEALIVLSSACLFRHQFPEAERWIQKRIELFENFTPNSKHGFGNAKHRGGVYLELASCLNRQGRVQNAIQAAVSALRAYKKAEGENGVGICEVYSLLGKIYFEIKEWNRASVYLEKAADGFTSLLGTTHERVAKAREELDTLEKRMEVRRGLGDRLFREKERERLSKRW